MQFKCVARLGVGLVFIQFAQLPDITLDLQQKDPFIFPAIPVKIYSI